MYIDATCAWSMACCRAQHAHHRAEVHDERQHNGGKLCTPQSLILIPLPSHLSHVAARHSPLAT